jgi:hypothetical protein
MESMIESCCKQLKIGSTFYKGYKDIKADTHEQFLLELLQRELGNRETGKSYVKIGYLKQPILM